MIDLINLSYQQLVAYSAHIGHIKFSILRTATWFLIGERYSMAIINLLQSLLWFRRSLFFISLVIKNFGKVMFVNTDKFASQAIKVSADLCAQPYVINFWLGGCLTNWKVMVVTNKAVGSLTHPVNPGLTGCVRLPTALFVSSGNTLLKVKNDSLNLLIPIISVIDTVVDSHSVLYPIPGNDDSVTAIIFYNAIISKIILINKLKSINRFRNLKKRSW